MKTSIYGSVAMLLVTGIAASVCAAADPTPEAARGSRLFLQCQACHSLQPGISGNVGPSLAGVVGRKAASVEGYPYSAALSASGLVWDEATLDHWMEHPGALVPGTKMIFSGIANRDDRLAIIAYLRTAAATTTK